MDRYDCEDDKEFEKGVEWNAYRSITRHEINFGDLLPEGALPYVHGCSSAHELHELLDVLQSCMTGLEYDRLLPKMKRFFPREWMRSSELGGRPLLYAVN